MKVHSYARNMNLNRKCANKYVRTQNLIFLNKMVNFFFFLSKMLYSRLGYLAVIMF